MIALVTGASGFIGAHLVEALVADGIEVRLLRRPGSSHGSPPRGTAAHTIDLAAVDARRASVWQGVTHVFHLAARTRALNPADFVSANVVPTARLAELVTQLPSVPRLVFVSSQAAAGPARSAAQALTDADASNPVDAYGRSKHEAEAAVRVAGVPAVIIRPSAVYGPRDRDFLQVFQQLGRPIALQAVPAWHRLSLVHVHDLVTALRLAAVRDEAVGKTYFVEDGAPTSWGSVYDEVAQVLGRSPRRLTVPATVLRLAAIASELAAGVSGVDPLLTRAKLELAQHPYWLCQATGLREALGWRPLVARADGWARTHQWYREAQWIR